MKHLLFVYGSLKWGYGNHHILGSSNLIDDGIIVGFKMYSMGAFPALVFDDSLDRTVGELYEISDATFQRCDNLEGYPNFYDRKMVKVYLSSPDDRDKCDTREAWVYFMHAPDGYMKPMQKKEDPGGYYSGDFYVW